MAERRSIYKKISLSETIDSISGTSQLFFTWSIPHADDIGALPRSPKVLKATVFPLKEKFSVEDTEKCVQECIGVGLYKEVSIEDEKFLIITGFNEHQTLKRDRNPQIILPIKLKEAKDKNWKILDDFISGIQMEPTGIQLEPEEKGREGKRRESSASKSTQKEEKKENTPNAAQFIKFFHEAVKSIRRVSPVIDGGKDGKLIKDRLKKLSGDVGRLEMMTIWYLTRKKRTQTGKGEWVEDFKNPPSISTMLSTSYFNQLLSEEQNARNYVGDNLEWIQRFYKKDEQSEIVDMKKQLQEKFKITS